MQAAKTLSQKYDELVEAGYIVPLMAPLPLEMPTALIYVPTYTSDHTVPYEADDPGGRGHGELVRHSERDQ